MFRFKVLLDSHTDELARLLTAEHGKVLSDARGELIRGIEVVEFACGIPQLLKSEFTENVGTGSTAGPSASGRSVRGITPFNFPAMVPMWMFRGDRVRQHVRAEALGEGSERADARCGTADRGRLAGGVFNVVNGDREAVTRC